MTKTAIHLTVDEISAEGETSEYIGYIGTPNSIYTIWRSPPYRTAERAFRALTIVLREMYVDVMHAAANGNQLAVTKRVKYMLPYEKCT